MSYLTWELVVYSLDSRDEIIPMKLGNIDEIKLGLSVSIHKQTSPSNMHSSLLGEHGASDSPCGPGRSPFSNQLHNTLCTCCWAVFPRLNRIYLVEYTTYRMLGAQCGGQLVTCGMKQKSERKRVME